MWEIFHCRDSGDPKKMYIQRMFACLLNALMISGRSLLVIPVSLILYLQMHDVHFIDRHGTSVSASCGNLSIRSISGIQLYFAGNSAKWNDTCRVKSRHCLTFSSYIIAALMRFGQKNPYQSPWLVSGQSKEQEFQLKKYIRLHLLEHTIL